MCVSACQGENCLNLSVSFLCSRNAMVWAWNLFKHILKTHGCNTTTQNYHSTVLLHTLTGWAAPLVSHSCALWLITKWQQILKEKELVCFVSSILQYANKPTMPDSTAGIEDRMQLYIYFSVLYHTMPHHTSIFQRLHHVWKHRLTHPNIFWVFILVTVLHVSRYRKTWSFPGLKSILQTARISLYCCRAVESDCNLV